MKVPRELDTPNIENANRRKKLLLLDVISVQDIWH